MRKLPLIHFTADNRNQLLVRDFFNGEHWSKSKTIFVADTPAPMANSRSSAISSDFGWSHHDHSKIAARFQSTTGNRDHVPPIPKQPFTDEQLLSRLEQLTGLTDSGRIRFLLESARSQGSDTDAEQIRQSILARMYDVSAFMKHLKQRFTTWYNRRHGVKGYFWEERFKSVLVESAGPTLATMAAYIDLNPVRAKLVDCPEHYRWCGYAEAIVGSPLMKASYDEMFRGHLKPGQDVLSAYRVWLYGQGSDPKGITATGEPIRLTIDPTKVKAVLAADGKLTLQEYLRCKVRYFSDGMAFGSREFVNEIFVAFRDRFGSRRKDGARQMDHIDQPFFTLRALRIDSIRPSG